MRTAPRKSIHLVVCALDPYVLFEKLLPEENIAPAIKQPWYQRPKVSAAKLHFLLKDLPPFETLKEIGHNHKGVIVIAPSTQAVTSAALDVPAGKLPEKLMLTMAFPTLEDPSLCRSPLTWQTGEETTGETACEIAGETAGETVGEAAEKLATRPG